MLDHLSCFTAILVALSLLYVHDALIFCCKCSTVVSLWLRLHDLPLVHCLTELDFVVIVSAGLFMYYICSLRLHCSLCIYSGWSDPTWCCSLPYWVPVVAFTSLSLLLWVVVNCITIQQLLGPVLIHCLLFWCLLRSMLHWVAELVSLTFRPVVVYLWSLSCCVDLLVVLL